jgi:hypothetical protein
LAPASSALEDAGKSVYDAVRDLDDDCDRMPEARAWSGTAHDAATAMFGRATRETSKFKSHADAVDQGALQVTDQWVVLIKPARVSAEEAASLLAQAETEQKEINQLLLAVGQADNGTADKVQAAAKDFGFVMPTPGLLGNLDPTSGFARPADDILDPTSVLGMMQQGTIRDQDMATTVRENREWTTSDGQGRQTIVMMDGSKHEIYTWIKDNPCVEDTYYDKHGNEVSSTFTQDRTNYDGSQYTSITFGDGTEVTMTRTADGTCTGGVITPDGRQGVLPDQFFTHPALTTVGGALTGLEGQTKRGIPMLTAESVENLGKAGKCGGPVLGVATALYDTVTASTLQDACVAAISGGAGVAGGELTGAGLALAFPEASPLLYAGGNMLGGWTFGYVGGIIGNIVCR